MSIAALAAAGIPAVLELIKSLVPSLASSASSNVVSSTVSVLAEYTPLVVAEYKALRPIVENAITAIRANPNTLPEQLEKLREMATQYDLEWADALAVSRAGDAAAGY